MARFAFVPKEVWCHPFEISHIKNHYLIGVGHPVSLTETETSKTKTINYQLRLMVSPIIVARWLSFNLIGY